MTLRVFSIEGRLVATLAEGEFPEGSHTVTWNGRDASGRAVAAGVYFYALEAGPFRASHRALLMR